MESFSNIKSTAQKDREHKIYLINNDIELIKQALASNSEENMRRVHMQIDAKYQSCIRNWGQGMYNYIHDHGFAYNYIGKEGLIDNLTMMISKLEAFREGWNDYQSSNEDKTENNIVISNSNSNNNNINIEITFDELRQKIEDMPGLTDSETEEIKKKIDELENILEETVPRKKKWEKVKPILKFMLDKGADVAIAFMSLFAQAKFF